MSRRLDLGGGADTEAQERSDDAAQGHVVEGGAAAVELVEPDGVAVLPDRDPTDRTRVERTEFHHPGGADVVLLRVDGGGHTWPGGVQYLPESVIGRTSLDVDASEIVRDFFAARSRR